ncbi:MAG: hypothetical protein AAF404_00325 [Pseudomonadota bacterium]
MNPIAFRVLGAAMVPVLVAAVYFGIIASDRYVSESSVVIRSGASQSAGFTLGGLLPLSGSNGQDVVVVSDYILSSEMIKYLDDTLSLTEHYSDAAIDVVSRFNADHSFEQFQLYMADMISVVYEETTEIISIKVSAFTPEMAYAINQEVISKSEQLINELSNRIVEDTLSMASNEVSLALDNARSVSARLSRFSADNNSLDPTVESGTIISVIASLEAKLAEARALFSEKSAYLRESSAEMRAIKNRIDGLQTQLARERQKITVQGEHGMGQLLEDYKPLLVEEELARQRYASALLALETARTESLQKKQYLEMFVRPNLPTSSTEPARLLDAISAVLISFLLYAIFALCRAAVREHIDFAS